MHTGPRPRARASLRNARYTMSDDETHRLLREIRDLQAKQLEVAQQALHNQAQALGNQTQALKHQQEYRAGLLNTRRWGVIVFWVIAGLIALYLIQPWLFVLTLHPPR